jgi:hypothetical protein
MAKQNDNSGRIDTARLTPASRYRAVVALRDRDGSPLNAGDWLECLGDPERLLDNPDAVLKSDGVNTVILKDIRIAGHDICVVIKSQRWSADFRNALRSAILPRSVRNFLMSARLHAAGIPVAYPLAAIFRRERLHITHDIFISAHIAGSCNLYEFLRDGLLPEDHRLKVRKQLALQTANLLAGLHRQGLYHRDAKSSNFLIQLNRDMPGGQSAGEEFPRVFLIDMDGIKPCFFRRRTRRLVSAAKLASTILCHKSINQSDFLRTFTACEEDLGIDRETRRADYRSVCSTAIAIRLLTMANVAMEGRGEVTNTDE